MEVERLETANQSTHIRPNYAVIYLTSLNIFLGSFKMYLTALVGFQMVGINHWALLVLFEPEHPGLRRINLDQRFHFFSYMEQAQE